MPFIKGYKWTDKQREFCGFKKGIIPWNKDKNQVYSKTTLQLWSEQRKGRISPFKGKKHSQDSILKLSESAKRRINKSGPKGKPWSLLRREAQIKRNRKSYKKSVHLNFRRERRKSIIKNNKEYPFNWHEIRKNIYKRDGWRCQECGVHCGKKQQIQCHHIDFDTTNNTFSNLITLCNSCHMKTQFNKENWIKYYKNLMEVRGLMVFEN